MWGYGRWFPYRRFLNNQIFKVTFLDGELKSNRRQPCSCLNWCIIDKTWHKGPSGVKSKKWRTCKKIFFFIRNDLLYKTFLKRIRKINDHGNNNKIVSWIRMLYIFYFTSKSSQFWNLFWLKLCQSKNILTCLPKGGFKSEETWKKFWCQKKYSKSLSWAENLNFPPKKVNSLLKFSAQDLLI